jgi:hypothetical protein
MDGSEDEGEKQSAEVPKNKLEEKLIEENNKQATAIQNLQKMVTKLQKQVSAANIRNHELINSKMSDNIYEVFETPSMGRGLRAAMHLQNGTVLFRAPTICFKSAEYEEHIKHTAMNDYVCQGPSGNYHLPLHLGGMINHSNDAVNVSWELDEDANTILYRVMGKHIKKGEEFFIAYNLWGMSQESFGGLKMPPMPADAQGPSQAMNVADTVT